jgi:hypothetical protein
VADRSTFYVPYAEADEVTGAARRVVGLLDELVVARSGGREVQLAAWSGDVRSQWDEEFAYAQADLQASIDDLQALCRAVDDVVGQVEDHNTQVVFMAAQGELHARVVPEWERRCGPGRC